MFFLLDCMTDDTCFFVDVDAGAGAVRLHAAGGGWVGVPARGRDHRHRPLWPALVARRDRQQAGSLPRHLRHQLSLIVHAASHLYPHLPLPPPPSHTLLPHSLALQFEIHSCQSLISTLQMTNCMQFSYWFLAISQWAVILSSCASQEWIHVYKLFHV